MTLRIGQAQLLRKQLSNELHFTARMDSSLLSGALRALNQSLLADVLEHYARLACLLACLLASPLLSSLM